MIVKLWCDYCNNEYDLVFIKFPIATGKSKICPRCVSLQKTGRSRMDEQNAREAEQKARRSRMDEQNAREAEQKARRSRMDEQKAEEEHERLKEGLLNDAKGCLGFGSIVLLFLFVIATCNGGGGYRDYSDDYWCGGVRC